MQGKKTIVPKMLYTVHLEELVSKDNFYRKVNTALNWQFLYKETQHYYGSEGQESIDPVVFFKICLVGYLNNIGSDRKLIEHCSDSLAIRLFIQYDIDEPLPWHSTISRTRQLYGEQVFLSLFKKILSLCIEKGMVRGKRQCIDSAFIKANASMDSLLKKEILEDVEQYSKEFNERSEYRVTMEDKATGQTDEHGNFIRAESLSNQTYYSPTDPDARIAVKPGKMRQLYYSGQIAVDDSHHVITGAMADFSDKKDSQSLPAITEQTIQNLEKEKIFVEQIVADTNYSSAEALSYCEEKHLDAYLPNFGQYKPQREGFIYNEEKDQYECQQANKAILSFREVRRTHQNCDMKVYRSSVKDCKGCPLRKECIGQKTLYKTIRHSVYKTLYDKMHLKMQTPYAKRISRIRSATVEPVLGTLINFLNMKRVNTRGIQQATKHVLMAALAYNLKKYMKFISRKANIHTMVCNIEGKTAAFLKMALYDWISSMRTREKFLLRAAYKRPIEVSFF